jgi:hypothetical protein
MGFLIYPSEAAPEVGGKSIFVAANAESSDSLFKLGKALCIWEWCGAR